MTPPLARRTRSREVERAVSHLATETLALGCLYERRGAAHIRIPVHRRQQFAGCEWHGRRVGGRLVLVAFTCEPLEDWLALAEAAPDDMPGLYRDILHRPDIAARDLFWANDVYARTPDGHALVFRAGSYNALNPWNTVRGAVHLNGGARGGFGEELVIPPAPRLSLRLPDRGLLFLEGRDRTGDVLRATRRCGRGGVDRLEAAVPDGEDWALDDLLLPNGEGFTALGLVSFLAAGDEPPAEPTLQARPVLQPVWGRPRPPQARRSFLPGRLVAGAMLRQIGIPPMGTGFA